MPPRRTDGRLAVARSWDACPHAPRRPDNCPTSSGVFARPVRAPDGRLSQAWDREDGRRVPGTTRTAARQRSGGAYLGYGRFPAISGMASLLGERDAFARAGLGAEVPALLLKPLQQRTADVKFPNLRMGQ